MVGYNEYVKLYNVSIGKNKGKTLGWLVCRSAADRRDVTGHVVVGFEVATLPHGVELVQTSAPSKQDVVGSNPDQ